MFDFDSREEILWAMVKPGVWRHHVLLIDASSFMGKSSMNDIYVPFPCFQYRTVYIYIPAKPLSRRRQNCHSSRSNFAPRAGETRFFLCLSSKKCILTCGHQ